MSGETGEKKSKVRFADPAVNVTYVCVEVKLIEFCVAAVVPLTAEG